MPARAVALTPAASDRLGPLGSPGLRRELPGLAAALDPDAARAHLDRALGHGGSAGIVGCAPRHATYVPGRGCTLRYAVTLDGRGEHVVNAQLFGSVDACRCHHRERLIPLARRAGARGLTGPFAAPVAVVEGLRMTVAAFPLDGRLPELVDAFDPAVVGGLLAPGRAASGRCRVTLERYGRGNRCLLRYELSGEGRDAVVAYGKVADDDRGAAAAAVLGGLRARMPRLAARCRFGVPRPLGYHPRLRLLLLEAVAGEPRLSRLLKAAARGEQPPAGEIDRTVAACAEIAAGLHTSGVTLGPTRPAAADVAALAEAIAGLRRIDPGLGRVLHGALLRVDERLRTTRALRPALCHGDFKHNQVLFGNGRTLVDFDTACQAEPALDVGHFCAYLRLKAAGEGPAAAERLTEVFLAAYADAAARAEDEAALRERAAAYEALSLVGRAVHSWQKFKLERLAAVLDLLDERLSCPAV